MKNRITFFVVLFSAAGIINLSAQSRIKFNNQDLFLSGANFAWVNFAYDIGPGTTNLAQFESIFQQVSANGGNAMRLWLHTTGANTPQFNDTGLVIGPGVGAVQDLKQILDIAWKYHVGVKPCLWSFDMMRTSNGATIYTRSRRMLEDTVFLQAYIDNSLIPMVTALKEHPAIIAWEIFNEPEGMSNEHGWDFNQHVPMSLIQRFINRTSGAIHRTDPKAQVTNGSWAFIASTDVPTRRLGKTSAQLSETEKVRMEKQFELKYSVHRSAEEIVSQSAQSAAAANTNYYSDSRLIAAGGDPDGKLDFYSVHYYDWGGTAISPFAHPKSYWNLDKPVVIAEFAINNNFPGIAKDSLYDVLFMNGYAGSLAWSWTDVQLSSPADMLASMLRIKTKFPSTVTITLPAGTILSFSATPSTIEQGDSTFVRWKTSSGSSATLNGTAVAANDSLFVKPDTTTTYTLISTGAVSDTNEITVTVLPTGTIVTFTAMPTAVGIGEQSKLRWHTVAGSTVTLNGQPVASTDSLTVSPISDSTFTLISTGNVSDTAIVKIILQNAASVNRALHRPVVSLSSEAIANVSNPANVADGLTTTRWSSLYADNQWIRIDLGQTFDIQHVILRWEAAYGKIYKIQISNDTINWTDIHFKQNGAGGVDDITGLTGIARFIRMLGLVRGTQWGFSLWEFEVYGIPAVLSVDDQLHQIPSSFQLEQNFPNPFNPATVINYQVPVTGVVTLTVYDMIGREVAVLVNGIKSAGRYSETFNASSLASGVYFMTMRAGNFYAVKKITLLK